MDDHGSPALRGLIATRGSAVLATHAQHGDATATVDPDALLAVLGQLRDDPTLAFEMLTDLTCVDHLEEEPRFEIVYHLYSVTHNRRVRIKARLEGPGGANDLDAAAPAVDSAVPLWPSANWLEREVWDLYGVRFRGHPDLRRLLLDEAFEGHPLRKDYPKTKRQPLAGSGGGRS